MEGTVNNDKAVTCAVKRCTQLL